LTAIPPQIGNLKTLIFVSLQNTSLTAIPPEMANLVNVEYLYAGANKLSGSFPSWIGNLKKLKKLALGHNQFTGSIPSPVIANLTNLQELYLDGDQGLTGKITPYCFTTVYAVDTGLNICGCSSIASPPGLFPPAGTPDECLASGPATALQKRVEIFSQTIGSQRYTCNVDVNKNPHADCFNAQAKICNPTYIGTDATRLSDCKNGVDKMALNMSTYWQAVRRECGQWAWNGFIGNKDSTKCAAANADLIKNTYYTALDKSQMKVTSDFTTSVNVGLWSNTQLEG